MKPVRRYVFKQVPTAKKSEPSRMELIKALRLAVEQLEDWNAKMDGDEPEPGDTLYWCRDVLTRAGVQR